MCQDKAVASGRSTRVSTPASSNKHNSTRSATSEKMEKLVPTPSNVAPSGYGWPGQICMHTPTSNATQTPTGLDGLRYSGRPTIGKLIASVESYNSCAAAGG